MMKVAMQSIKFEQIILFFNYKISIYFKPNKVKVMLLNL